METKQEKLIPLSEIETGSRVRLVSIHGGHNVTRRLAAMGILPHTELEVVKNDHPGPFIIRIRGARIALGRGVAGKLLVK